MGDPTEAVPQGKVPGRWVPEWDVNGPFFPLVNTYTSALSALAVLADPKMALPVEPYGIGFSGKVLQSITVHADKARKRFLTELKDNKTDSVARLFDTLTCMLINATYESVKVQLKAVSSPLVEFYRHVRNGCSHSNSFFFVKDEPRRPASWRGVVIDHSQKASKNPLFGVPVFAKHGLLHCADAILLLADVEKECLGGTGGKMVAL